MSHDSTTKLYDIPAAHVVKWLIGEGTKVKEDQQIAEIWAPGLYSKQLVRQVLKAPVDGRIIHLSPIQPPPPHMQHQLSLQQPKQDLLPISTKPVAQISYCTHSVVYSGLCTLCAVNVLALPPRSRKLWEMCHAETSAPSATDKANEEIKGGQGHKRRRDEILDIRSGGAGRGGGDAIPRGMTQIRVQHGFELSVSSAHATNADSEILSRLRSRRKLCLVLDIDHTLIHCVSDEKAAAFAVSLSKKSTTDASSSSHEITLDNSNVSTSKPVVEQSLPSTVDPSEVFSWNDGTLIYAIKKRPYLSEFLESASDFFELQVDTAGTRTYAQMILTHIDPEKRLFGDRIVSRCDSRLRHKQVAWLHRAVKDDSMVVIVDDTTEIWRGARNLLSIEPYMFWKCGVSRAELFNVSGRSMADTSYSAPCDSWDEVPEEKTALNPTVFEEEKRPFLKDILRFLKEIHKEYYDDYDLYQSSLRSLSSTSTTKVSSSAHMSSTSLYSKSVEEGISQISSKSSMIASIPRVPSVPDIIHRKLRSILSNICVVFSGVFSLGADDSDETNLWKRVLEFGGTIAESPESTRSITKSYSQFELEEAVAKEGSEVHNAHNSSAAYTALQNFNKKIVTHLVYRTEGTAKFESANKDPAIYVVPLAWLEQSLLQYQRLPEDSFLSTRTLGHVDATECANRILDLQENKRLVLAEAVARKRAADAQNLLAEEEEEEEEEEKDDRETDGKNLSALSSVEFSHSIFHEYGEEEEEDFGAELEALEPEDSF